VFRTVIVTAHHTGGNRQGREVRWVHFVASPVYTQCRSPAPAIPDRLHPLRISADAQSGVKRRDVGGGESAQGGDDDDVE
jgi:hypothetical protein